MIWLILILAFLLRLVNLNQSLWLDEAVQAITAKGSFWGIFEELRGDFHPSLYHILLWGWVRILGAGEISLRIPSVIFGVGTVLVIKKLTDYGLRIKKLTNYELRISGLIGAIFLATAPFHIYYSQEARMYSMATFFAALSMYFFVKVINRLTDCELRKLRINELTNYGLKSYGLFLGYFVSTVCLIYSDYYGFLVLLAQIIGGVIIFRKNLNLYISKFLYFYIPIFLFYLPWLPFLIIQLKTGLTATAAVPEWKNLVNASFLKAIPLTFVKFAIGRITVFDKKIYGLVAVAIFLFYGWIGGCKGYKSYKDNKYYKLILLWFLVPVLMAWLGSLIIPNYQPFRLLLVLPAFYLLLAFGIFSFPDMMIRNIIAGVIIGVNLISLGVYYFNPYFWREDWRGVVNYLKKEQIPLVISSDTFSWPIVYYGGEKNLIAVGRGVRKIEDEDKISLFASLDQIKEKRLAYTSYLADLYDPEKKIPDWLKEMGFDKMKEISFNQVLIELWEKD